MHWSLQSAYSICLKMPVIQGDEQLLMLSCDLPQKNYFLLDTWPMIWGLQVHSESFSFLGLNYGTFPMMNIRDNEV